MQLAKVQHTNEDKAGELSQFNNYERRVLMLYKQQVKRTSIKLNKTVKIILILVTKVQQLGF